MKYTVRLSTIHDLIKLEKNSTENGKVDRDTIEKSTEIRTFCCDNEPLAMIGLQTAGNKAVISAAVWGMFDKKIEKHKIALVKFCKDLIFDRRGYDFYALIDESNEKFVRFIRYFGFNKTKQVEKIGDTLYTVYVKET